MESLSYVLVPSAFGTLSIVWQETGAGPKVRRVFLPSEGILTRDRLQMAFPDARPRSCAADGGAHAANRTARHRTDNRLLASLNFKRGLLQGFDLDHNSRAELTGG